MPLTTTLRALRGAVLAVSGLVWITACEKMPMQPAAQRGVMRSETSVGNMFPVRDPSGTIATYSTTGSLDLGNPFFQSLGTNGRSCATCHIFGDGLGLSTSTVKALFASSGGNDPLFATVDGTNCPTASAGLSSSSLSAPSLARRFGHVRCDGVARAPHARKLRRRRRVAMPVT